MFSLEGVFRIYCPIIFTLVQFRFISLMEGHIWLESEGAGKGCTATFIVKLGVCEKTKSHLQQIVPATGSNNGDADISGPRAPFRDEHSLLPSRFRYQRSV